MRENRTSGSEGGGHRNHSGLPTPINSVVRRNDSSDVYRSSSGIGHSVLRTSPKLTFGRKFGWSTYSTFLRPQ